LQVIRSSPYSPTGEPDHYGFDSDEVSRVLGGLAEKLFMDDYRYAARATGALDADHARAAYFTVATNVWRAPQDSLPTSITEQDVPPGSAAKQMAAHSAGCLRNPQRFYRLVWDVIRVTRSTMRQRSTKGVFMSSTSVRKRFVPPGHWNPAESGRNRQTSALHTMGRRVV
jgi:hypothetical protein